MSLQCWTMILIVFLVILIMCIIEHIRSKKLYLKFYEKYKWEILFDDIYVRPSRR